MRLPNGFGTVWKLSGARRRPWVARKTVGYTSEGKQIQKIVGYYATKKEAVEALGAFAANPYDLTKDKVTVDQMFVKAIEREQYADNTKYGYMSVYKKHFESIKSLPYKDLTLEKAQAIIDSIPTGNQGNARSVFLMMERYSIENGYTVKAFASFIRKHQHEIVTDRVPFDYSEIKALWDNCRDEGAKLLLIYLYTGFRANELLDIKKDKVFINADIPYLQGGSKTKAGKNRIIPIHSRIMPIIKEFMAADCDYLIPIYRNTSLLRKPVNQIKSKLNLNHCLHECRHTFRSELDRRGANKISIDRLLGHATQGVGERVYTHKTIAELKEAIELITYEE